MCVPGGIPELGRVPSVVITQEEGSKNRLLALHSPLLVTVSVADGPCLCSKGKPVQAVDVGLV